MSDGLTIDWDAPLDVEAHIRAIPARMTIKGLFPAAMLAEAKRLGLTLPSARDRYLAFHDYPLVEHARILVEAAGIFSPDLPLRRGLRRLGRRAISVFLESTAGRVLFTKTSDGGVFEAIEATAKSYAVTMTSAFAEAISEGPGQARVTLERVYTFVDCHHIGLFEGVLHTVSRLRSSPPGSETQAASVPYPDKMTEVTLLSSRFGGAELRCRWDVLK